MVHHVSCDTPKIFDDLMKGTTVICHVDSDRRTRMTINHSSEHAITHCLFKELGMPRECESTLVYDDYFTAHIPRMDAVPTAIYQSVHAKIKQLIKDDIPIHCVEMDLKKALKIKELDLKSNVKYPPIVRVVSFGYDPSKSDDPTPKNSMELCCGTHALSTSQLKSIIITSDIRAKKTYRKLDGVAGLKALEALERGRVFGLKVKEIEDEHNQGKEDGSFTDDILFQRQLKANIKKIRAQIQSETLSIVDRANLEARLAIMDDPLSKMLKEFSNKFIKEQQEFVLGQLDSEKKFFAIHLSVILFLIFNFSLLFFADR